MIIEYGFVLNHMPTEMVNQPPLTFVPISETRGQVILGAVGCSNSPAGHEVLAAINEALPPLMRSEEYLRAVSRWLVPATMQRSTGAGMTKRYIRQHCSNEAMLLAIHDASFCQSQR
ncbi:hypothetical protein ULG90_04645 [Halopseudomonas pachastrellae]|nr:hypothetical protein ULG90_04645 [Halopseudomonas pachastrellae]